MPSVSSSAPRATTTMMPASEQEDRHSVKNMQDMILVPETISSGGQVGPQNQEFPFQDVCKVTAPCCSRQESSLRDSKDLTSTIRYRLTVGQKGIIRLPRFSVNLYRTQPGGGLIVGQRALSFFEACILLVQVATARESLRAGQRPAILLPRFAVCVYRWWQPLGECKSRAEL